MGMLQHLMCKTGSAFQLAIFVLNLSAATLSYADEPAKNAPSARQWLDRMSRNMQALSYQGVFTYEQGANIYSLQIYHQVKDGVEHERLVHLDGEPRELIRKGHQLTCVHAGTQRVRLDHSIPAGAFGQKLVGANLPLNENYQLQILGEDRVAGRTVEKLAVRPKDNYRLAHMLYLDKDTGLLLKSIVLDDKSRPLERFQFAKIDIGGEIDPKDLKPGPGHQLVHHPQPISKANNTAKLPWQVGWVPSGFTIAERDLRHQAEEAEDNPEQNGEVESYMYTDGLSAFSVFLEPTKQFDGSEGSAQQGATVAFTRQMLLDGSPFIVTVVGEVPGITAERVASSVQRR